MIGTVRIDRSRWRNAGHDMGLTKLLNEQGYMCCLGFACQQLGGLEDKEIYMRASPMGTACSTQRILRNKKLIQYNSRYAYFRNSLLAEQAMLINDKDMPESERELKLVNLFADHDIKLEFYGEYNNET